MRLGVFGGSFDPPHVGHLLTAGDAFEALELDRMLFVPAGVQPLKAHAMVAQPHQRREMVGLAIAGDARFELDPVEIERDGLSFTVDTLEAVAGRFPGAELYLVVGADILATFDKWRQPERVLQLASLAVMRRAGTGDASASSAAGRMLRSQGSAPRYLDTRRIDVSSTEIRARVRAGRSIHGFVPASVGEFIASARLYR